MILPPRSSNTSFNEVFLEDHLKPRDGGLGAFPDSSNILIALGVIIGLATICLFANFGLIRCGHRSLLSRLFCCASRRREQEQESSIVSTNLKTRKVKVLKKPRIYDVSLVSHHTRPDDIQKLSWRSITPISVRYVYGTSKLKSNARSNTPPLPSVSAFPIIAPPLRAKPSTPPSINKHGAAIRVSVAIAMPHDPNACNIPCYELGTADIAAPWKTREHRKKEILKLDRDTKENIDHRMAEAMLLRSVAHDYRDMPISVAYMAL